MDKGVLFSQAPLAGLLFLPLSCKEGLIREGEEWTEAHHKTTPELPRLPGCTLDNLWVTDV